MLTLQHIWDMMNSSKPLSSVLNAIVNSLQGELGYLYSFIVKEKADNNGKYLQIVASSRDDLDIKFSEKFKCNVSDFRMNFPEINEIKNAVKNNQIYQSTNLSELVCGFIPELDTNKVEEFLREAKMKSYILVPLMSKQTHFGSLLVFSSRETVSGSELNFLSLFAKQIELAITIADLFQAVKEQAITDGMTGLYNRRYFEEFIKKEIAHGNIDLARQVIAENFGEKTISFEKNVFDKISVITLSTNKIDIFSHGNSILFCSEFNKPDLERGYLIVFNKCRMINIYHKTMVNITNIIPDVNENENRKLKYLFLVGAMEK